MDPQINIDRRKLTPEQVAQLDQWQMTHDQLTAVRELGTVLQKVQQTLDNQGKSGSDSSAGTQALLKEMRDCLAALKDKEDPEAPDYAQPVVDAVSRLEEAFTASLSALDVKPTVNVEAPNVKVAPTPVKLDFSKVENILQTEVPKAFEEAINRLPQPEIPDHSELLQQLVETNEWLASIDRATRLKPQAPNQLKVVNPDNSYVGSPTIFREFDDIEFSNADANGNYQTILFKLSGVTQKTLLLVFDGNNKVTSITRS